ncbi:class I adenylate-forming enzyme family protein [Jongsikchunia kroppenstedtii]|uniref:class I adenylate-forming enzyme family protein n=1 Tax=Jongsikchunia kroppenstedtii TaxID=1121721 RepID=UPI0003682197|nr:AMP-binding protein [Jongsikchunia kroppenstedtii]
MTQAGDMTQTGDMAQAGADAVGGGTSRMPGTATDFTLDHALRVLAAGRPDAPAWSCHHESVTYGELLDRSEQVAAGLRAAGVRPGDRVVHISRNRGEWFEILFGCARVGAVLASINWRLPASDIAGLIADSGASVAFVENDFVAAAVDVGLRVVFGDEYAHWRDAWSGAHGGPESFVPTSDIAVIQFYTSGTTGAPKGVVIEHRNLGYLMRAGRYWRLEAGSVTAAAMPFFHMGGSAWGLVALLTGGHCVVVSEFDPPAFLDLLGEYSVTNMLVAPTMLQMLLSVRDVADRDYGAMRSIVYGSAPISRPLLQAAIDVFDAPLIQIFGLTESCGGIVQLDPEDHHGDLLRSVGRPYPWVELEVHGHDGTRLGTGETGEIWVRSPQCAAGYWRMPDETTRLHTPDGWLRTGDAGHLTADGYLYITDRFKDMIITGGENVYPADVERVLVEHSAVAEVAVFGVAHDKWGEEVTAAVVLRSDADVAGPEILEWSRSRLAGFMRPRSVHILDELPRNPTGKVLKHVLRQHDWSKTPDHRPE